MANKTTSKKPQSPRLQLHNLITALSFWGTTVRVLLFGFLATVTLLVALAQSVAPDHDIALFIYVLASFLLFDASFVMLGRGLPLKEAADRAFLVGVEAIITLAYVVPHFALVPAGLAMVVIWVGLVVFGLVSVRSLLGLLYSKRV